MLPINDKRKEKKRKWKSLCNAQIPQHEGQNQGPKDVWFPPKTPKIVKILFDKLFQRNFFTF